jgi:predicted CxxxxCH...CXXCH cytochrome family protein
MRWAAIVPLIAGCSTVRPVDMPISCPDWVTVVGPLVAEDCVSCHGGAQPAGGVDLSTYATALQVSPARLAAIVDPATADSTHAPFVAAHDTLANWVAPSCDRAHVAPLVHPAGIADPSSGDFHGTLLRSTGWNFAYCQKCHGDDFAGGISGVSCLGCHSAATSGPLGCTTCHGQPPSTGAHLAHASGRVTRPYDCTECHVKPAVTTDAGHLTDANGVAKSKATITFGALASMSTTPGYDNGSCDVYCHGASLADTNATAKPPSWSGGPMGCTGCHGQPPSSHTRSDCTECHARVAAPGGTIASKALHIDGAVSLGDDSGTCTACHSKLSAAHDSHTGAKHKLAAPLACSACHVQPATVTDPGHIDHIGGALVFPTTWTPGLAASDGATPSWDGTRCNNVYCHGGGTHLSADSAASILRAPAWTDIGTAALCGACHGVPPTTTPHTTSMTLFSCNACHAATIDATGALISGGKHLDGAIDAN